jgi:uncharacterized protein YbjQ (UPF0145 family)
VVYLQGYDPITAISCHQENNPRVSFEKHLYYRSKLKKSTTMILSTTHTIPEREIAATLGLVRGSTVRARNIGRDIVAGLKNIVGGEIEEYTQLQADAREQALQRMMDDAQKLGADAIVGILITTAMVSRGAAEILAYGTAVKLA